MRVATKLAASVMVLALSMPAWCAKKVDLDYHVKLLPQSDQAEVRLSLSQGSAVRSLNFDLGRDGDYSDFKALAWSREAWVVFRSVWATSSWAWAPTPRE